MEARNRAKWMWGGAFLAAALILFLLTPGAPPSFPLPSSNGYDDFLKAAALLRGDGPPTRPWTDTTDWMAVRTWMSQHAGSFSLVEAGLMKVCRVPIRTSTNYVAQQAQDRGALKTLTYGMMARAELAKVEGRTNDMFNAYLEAYRFAHELGRGGLSVDWLNQLSCEILVLQSFASCIPALSPRQCADALTVIRHSQAELERPKVVWRRTRAWQHATFDSSALAKARVAAWLRLITEAWQSRSLAPLDRLPYRWMLRRQENHEKTIRTVCDQLQQQFDFGQGHRVNAVESMIESCR